MIKASTLLLFAVLYSCTDGHTSGSQPAIIRNAPSFSNPQEKSDTLRVDLSRSTIRWKGTKMNGAGKHEGQIQLKEAYFTSAGGWLTGGKFTADMNTIQVTDIPEHEPVPRQRLNDHLKSGDFFDTETWPVSEFEITGIERIAGDSLKVSGNLTLKGITRNLTFTAGTKDQTFSARFTLDRFQWNIAYRGNPVDRALVDRDIELTIALKTESKLPPPEKKTP